MDRQETVSSVCLSVSQSARAERAVRERCFPRWMELGAAGDAVPAAGVGGAA